MVPVRVLLFGMLSSVFLWFPPICHSVKICSTNVTCTIESDEQNLAIPRYFNITIRQGSSNNLVTSHSAAAEFEMAKKCSKDFRTAMRTPLPRASKWAPTWWSGEASPKPFYGQPLDQVWSRLATKGFGTGFSRLSNGGSFRSSEQGRSHGRPEILWAFFCHFKTCCRAVIASAFSFLKKTLQCTLQNEPFVWHPATNPVDIG